MSLRKQPTFHGESTQIPYRQGKGNLFQPIRTTTLIWVVTLHQYGISAVVPQKSFSRETSDGITKNWLFSHANLSCG